MIQTERLTIRPVQQDDAAFLLELLNDPDFLQFIGDRGVKDLEQANEYIRGLVKKQSGTPWRLFIVDLKLQSTSIGVTSFLRRDEIDDPDIGFAFLPKYRGHGYAYEATGATLEHAMNTPGVKRVVAIVSPDNQRSMSLLKKLGYRRDREITIGSCNASCSLLFVPDERASQGEAAAEASSEPQTDLGS